MNNIKRNLMFTIFSIMLVLVGCNQNQSDTSDDISISSTKSPVFQINIGKEILEPPTLIIQIGEETIEPRLGTYSWSEPAREGLARSIHSDSSASPELVKNQIPIKVHKSEIVTFNFQIDPQEYEIREWDAEEDKITNTFKELVLTEHTGVRVFEVLAHWEQGTASYTFLVEVE